MQQLLATLQAAPPATASQPAAKPASKRVTDADREAYGEDLTDFIQRAAQDIADSQTAELRQTVSRLTAAMNQMQGVVPAVVQNQRVSAAEQFFSRLTQTVPDWQQVNDSPQFHEWLLSPDPMTGITRQTYLDDAQNTHDVGRVATIFNTWKQLTGKSEAQQRATPNRAKSELEMQVAPGKNLAAAPISTQQKRTWTRAEIQAFYTEVRQGKFKGKEAERAELEQDIFAAQRDGRLAA